jgi:hypothetical protein
MNCQINFPARDAQMLLSPLDYRGTQQVALILVDEHTPYNMGMPHISKALPILCQLEC